MQVVQDFNPNQSPMTTEHNFSGALATWKGIVLGYCYSKPQPIHSTDINLSELQKTLDVQGIELVDNQKESVVGRKALADKTKGT
jgi:homeobox protein cut-like